MEIEPLRSDLITISSVLPFNFIFPCIAHAKATKNGTGYKQKQTHTHPRELGINTRNETS